MTLLSYDLRAEGFNKWHDFNLREKDKLLEKLPDKNGVYVIRDRKEFGRFINSSDIVYIGNAWKNGLKDRVKKYFEKSDATRITNLRISSWLHKYDLFQISWKEIDNGRNRKNTDCPSTSYEKRLLALYEQEHGELPPFNHTG